MAGGLSILSQLWACDGQTLRHSRAEEDPQLDHYFQPKLICSVALKLMCGGVGLMKLISMSVFLEGRTRIEPETRVSCQDGEFASLLQATLRSASCLAGMNCEELTSFVTMGYRCGV